jgi:hypothetical protein
VAADLKLGRGGGVVAVDLVVAELVLAAVVVAAVALVAELGVLAVLADLKLSGGGRRSRGGRGPEARWRCRARGRRAPDEGSSTGTAPTPRSVQLGRRARRRRL